MEHQAIGWMVCAAVAFWCVFAAAGICRKGNIPSLIAAALALRALQGSGLQAVMRPAVGRRLTGLVRFEPPLASSALSESAATEITPAEPELRERLVAVARRMNASGINQGTSGNLSVRIPGGMLITPSSLPYEQMQPQDLVALDLRGRPLAAPLSGRSPSSEWRLHADILASRPEIQAVLHCHSVHATALACHGRGIPPFHYMTAVAGGDDIRCAPYATFGTAELSHLAVEALRERLACLLAQHGQVTLGSSLDQALRIAIEVETLAQMYLQALQLGEPPRLSPVQMAAVHDQFRTLLYGVSPAPSTGSGIG